MQTVFASRVRALPQPSREILLMAALETGGLPRASTYSTTDDETRAAAAGGPINPRSHRAMVTLSAQNDAAQFRLNPRC
jgi:hypothetical protein